MYVEVAIHIPVDRIFTYAVPAESRGETAVGKRVLVPLGKRSLTGTVIGIRRSTDRQDTKEITRVLDREPLFGEDDLRFYRWAAEYYFTPLGRAIGEILPGGIDIESLLWAVRLGEADDLKALQRDILGTLGRHTAGMALRRLEKELGRKALLPELRKLEGRGLVRLEERFRRPVVRGKTEKGVLRTEVPAETARLSERQREALRALERLGGKARVADFTEIGGALSLFRALEKKGLVAVRDRETLRSLEPAAAIGRTGAPPVLTPEQQTALEAVLKGIASGTFSPYLLHGVTGSGKTEVYIHAIAEAVRRGGRVLYLVPEIALTPQLVGRLESRFAAEEIAVLHSGIGPALRYDQWRRIARGEAKIVVGARSAVFAPVRDLRLIVVDEEHDTSYKQDERMPYNARDLAVVLAKQRGAAVILGSATPGLQSFYNTREKEFGYLCLTRRVEQREMPGIEIVDMKGERDPNGKVPPLSRRLVEQIARTLETKKQSLLFLNRRGFNTYHYCGDCAHVFRCLNCAVSLTHHLSEGLLRCHYCDFAVKAPPVCPECGGTRVLSYGLGTERLAAEVQGLFPQARVERMDSDTTSARGSTSAASEAGRSPGAGLRSSTQHSAAVARPRSMNGKCPTMATRRPAPRSTMTSSALTSVYVSSRAARRSRALRAAMPMLASRIRSERRRLASSQALRSNSRPASTTGGQGPVSSACSVEARPQRGGSPSTTTPVQKAPTTICCTGASCPMLFNSLSTMSILFSSREAPVACPWRPALLYPERRSPARASRDVAAPLGGGEKATQAQGRDVGPLQPVAQHQSGQDQVDDVALHAPGAARRAHDGQALPARPGQVGQGHQVPRLHRRPHRGHLGAGPAQAAERRVLLVHHRRLPGDDQQRGPGRQARHGGGDGPFLLVHALHQVQLGPQAL